MLWFKVWFTLAATMLILLILTHASYVVVGLCFLAWCGGLASTLMIQEQGLAPNPSPRLVKIRTRLRSRMKKETR